jgi:hypothetical protein
MLIVVDRYEQEAEEELDIELNEDEPAFLAGQTAMAQTFSPIKVRLVWVYQKKVSRKQECILGRDTSVRYSFATISHIFCISGHCWGISTRYSFQAPSVPISFYLQFCAVQTPKQCANMQVVKNPDGSMQRAATTQSALAKERREMRDMQVCGGLQQPISLCLAYTVLDEASTTCILMRALTRTQCA